MADRKPLPGALVIAALHATIAEASKRGEMFPQTADEQREDKIATRRVIGMVEFYTSERQSSATGWPSVKDWPALPNAGGDAVLAEVVKWALAGHITELGVTVEAGAAIRAVAAGVREDGNG